MKNTLYLLLLVCAPCIANAQKDSIEKLKSDIQTLQSQNQQLSARAVKLEDRIPYYESALKLQQSPIVQTIDGFDVRLTKVYYQEKEQKLYTEGLVISKKEGIHDLYFDGTMLKCIYPDGKIYQTYTILNNGKSLSTIGPIAMDVPYAFQIIFEKADKTPKLAALQFRINYTPEKTLMAQRMDFMFKGITVE